MLPPKPSHAERTRDKFCFKKKIGTYVVDVGVVVVVVVLVVVSKYGGGNTTLLVLELRLLEVVVLQ